MSGRPVVFIYPRGTYKSSTFYFRGEDVLKESEYIRKERKDLKQKLNALEEQLKIEKENFDKTNEELSKCDGFTVSLATALGDDSDNAAKNSQLRHQLAELTTKIEGTERAISKYKSQKNPSVIKNYQKELAFYETESEDLSIKILDGINSINNGKEEIAKLVCSESYATANIAKGIYQAKKVTYNHIRKEITDKKNDLDKIQSTPLLKGPVPALSQEIESLLEKKRNLIEEKTDVDQTIFNRREVMYKTSFALIDLIEKMNEILVALGGEKYDTVSLREKYKQAYNEQRGKQDREETMSRSGSRKSSTQQIDTTETNDSKTYSKPVMTSKQDKQENVEKEEKEEQEKQYKNTEMEEEEAKKEEEPQKVEETQEKETKDENEQEHDNDSDTIDME